MTKGNILCVDDDEGLQVVVKQYLESEGYKVFVASDGEEMLQELDSNTLDLILLDLMLPDSDGISLISQIRAKTQVPIVVVSGKSDTTEKIVCLEMGADDYMTKPFEMRELAARVKAALRRITAANDVPAQVTSQSSSGAGRKNVEFAGFTLDHNRYQLFDANGTALDITNGEYQLLEALTSAPNRALTREQLFERTRDGEFDAYDRAIDIQIGRIRKKIGQNGSDIIKTIRGVGYMFCPPPGS